MNSAELNLLWTAKMCDVQVKFSFMIENITLLELFKSIKIVNYSN